MENLVRNLKNHHWIRSDIVERVMCSIDRKEFVESNIDEYEAYADHPLYIGYGATISAPHMHAYALEMFLQKLSGMKKSEFVKVLDIGSGSGYLYYNILI